MNGAISRKSLAHAPQHAGCKVAFQFALTDVAPDQQGVKRTFTQSEGVGMKFSGACEAEGFDADQRGAELHDIRVAGIAIAGRKDNEVEIRNASLRCVEKSAARGAPGLLLDPRCNA